MDGDTYESLYTKWRIDARDLGIYAAVGWTVYDVQQIRPEWSDERALDFLVAYENMLRDDAEEHGWGNLETAIEMFGDREGERDED